MNDETNTPSIRTRSRKGAVDAFAEKVPEGRSAEIPTTSDPVKIIDQVIEVEHVMKSEKVEMLKFLEEPVDVIVHESTDQNAVPVVPLSINGVNHPIVRGVVTTVKRKYVALLASMRRTAYSQKTIQTPDGTVTQKMVPHTALRFPFSVVNDADPRGPAWLKTVLSQ